MTVDGNDDGLSLLETVMWLSAVPLTAILPGYIVVVIDGMGPDVTHEGILAGQHDTVLLLRRLLE